MTTLGPIAWADLVRARLYWGRDRAVTIGTLAESMGVSRRVVEKAVETMRRDGAPVVTCAEGVYLTDSPAELRAAYQALRRRYIHQAIGARALLRTAKRFEKHTQLGIWEAA